MDWKPTSHTSNAWRPLAARAAGGCVAIAAALVLYSVDPAEAVWLPQCLMHRVTDLHCPGCGSTRAAHALLHGDVSEALAKNILLVCGAPVLAAVWTWRRTRSKAATDAPGVLPARWIWTGLAVLVAFTVLRNVTAYPFNLLAPH